MSEGYLQKQVRLKPVKSLFFDMYVVLGAGLEPARPQWRGILIAMEWV